MVMSLMESLLGIAVGFALIKWSHEVVRWLGQYAGTGIIRDLDNPYVIKIVGFVVIAANMAFLLVPMF
ncbi:hypothetical protein H0X09_03565 [Candidatus Saccharibacteria bacterium]|nr:hypothetical protein [Candidatus Saccharibacteria bacterium]